MHTTPEIKRITLSSLDALDQEGLAAADEFFRNGRQVELIAGDGLYFYAQSYFRESPAMYPYGISESSMPDPENPDRPRAILVPDKQFVFIAVGKLLYTMAPPHMQANSEEKGRRMHLLVDPEAGLYAHLDLLSILNNLYLATEEELDLVRLPSLTPGLFDQMAARQASA